MQNRECGRPESFRTSDSVKGGVASYTGASSTASARLERRQRCTTAMPARVSSDDACCDSALLLPASVRNPGGEYRQGPPSRASHKSVRKILVSQIVADSPY